MADPARVPDDQDPDQPMDGVHDTSTSAQEGFLACDRCRRRKVKCGRGLPCRQCNAVGAQCTYDLGYKPRVRRQRALISNDLESNVEHISRSVDELKGMIEEMNLRQSQLAVNTPSALPSHQSSGPQAAPSTTAQPSPASAPTVGSTSTAPGSASQIEYGGESSLFAHALFATAFVQNAVRSSSSFEISTEMGPVMHTLSSIADAQKQKSDSIDELFPHARPLQDGRKPQDFKTPPTEKVFACLRMAQESHEVQAMWLPEFESLSHFTEYVIKVCSPGPTSEAELIIVNAGLYWLFLECASIIEDENVVLDYDSQASLCRENLETVLSHLGFHVPMTLDYVYALSMATTYCLQTLKTSAAWGFVSTASIISQALGLHSTISLHPESSEQKRRRSQLFWAVYGSEKPLALRIGRSSTFRDNDITIPRLEQPRGPDSLMRKTLPIWVEIACLQGRLYDEIYCPGAFLQPEHVRHARAHALISNITSVMEAEAALEREVDGMLAPKTAPMLSQLIFRADRITNLSMLTLIYRSLPPEDLSKSSFRTECVEMARKALEEHKQCLALLSPAIGRRMLFLGLFVDWAFLQMPFTPFTILFCHVIESSSAADLEALRSFLETLEGTPFAIRRASSKNQLHLFQVLYSVAVKYVAVKESSLTAAARGTSGASPAIGAQVPQSSTGGFRPGPSSNAETSASQDLMGSSFDHSVSIPGEDEFMANLGLQVDSSGGMLASWFASNHQLMRMLENS